MNSMKRFRVNSRLIATLVIAAALVGRQTLGAEDDRSQEAVFPVALLAFQDRGTEVEGLGRKVSDLLFIQLAKDPRIQLVDREDLQKQLYEQQLSLSGLVRPDQVVRVGQLTGARIIVTGSVLQVDKTIYLSGKVIGTETSRVVGCSAKGNVSDDLGRIAEQLAGEITRTIAERTEELVAMPVTREDRMSTLKRKLGKSIRPAVWIKIDERHVGQATIDPAAETELTMICRELGFRVLDSAAANRDRADIVISGEGLSEFAARHGSLMSVKCRLEIKAISRESGEVLAVDRQTSIGVDLSEQIAGKTALQECATQLAERLLPKLVNDRD